MLSKILYHYRNFMSATLGSSAQLMNLGQIAKISEMRALREELRVRQPDSVALKGFKVASQADEDGIIDAIFTSVDNEKTFLEIGVEDGTECNTHYLILQGWRGAWVEASDVHAATIASDLGGGQFEKRFKLFHDFAKTTNIASIYEQTCNLVSKQDLDFFSLDIDGNDIYVLKALLESGARPSVICVEYNGKFPPPICISVSLNETRGWHRDDYFGSSLQSFHNVLLPFGYILVTCNLAGTNAFYVRVDKASGLKALDIEEAWQPLRLHLTPLPPGHRPTLKYIRDVLKD